MPPERAVRIEGLAELRTAFRVAGTEMSKDLDSALKSSAEPVRTDAQSLALSGIRRIGLPWSRMRVGITRHTVYVAPIPRGIRSRARRAARTEGRHAADLAFAGMLGERALDPALDRNVEKVEQEVKDAIRDMGRAWERV
jgi:hypothetical protein